MNLSKEKILEELRNKKEFLIKEFDVKSISLTGSFAKGNYTEESDIDFVVEFSKVSYDSLYNLKVFLEDLFSRKVDIIRLRPSIKKRSLELIKKDMINVWRHTIKYVFRYQRFYWFDSISMRLQVIGETLKKISNSYPNYLNQFNEIEWKKIIGLRDIISHNYFDIDSEIIFDICKNHIPQLRETVNKIISDLEK